MAKAVARVMAMVAATVLAGPAAAAQPASEAKAKRTPAACAGPALTFERLAPGLWWVPGEAAAADAQNRGHVSHLLIGLSGTRIWAIGSGPSAAFGERLDCQVRQRFGRAITDVVSPWPHPELVLGQRGLPAARSWAHADVARSMAQRCVSCVERLRQRLGDAAADLGPDPIRIPDRLLQGRAGRLGPWQWWRLERGPETPVTVWAWRGAPVVFAPGLIWGSGAPDGQDARAQDLERASLALARRVQRPPGPPLRWLGEQGPLADSRAPQRHARYWAALHAEAVASVQRGDDASAPSPKLAGLESQSQGLLHELNWQRTWRQAEEDSFQRSRR